jgi:hypothetical protein
MDRFEQDLIAKHKKASKAYRKAVIELERHRRSGNRQRCVSFQAEVVHQAHLRCLDLFLEWCEMTSRAAPDPVAGFSAPDDPKRLHFSRW